MIQMKLIKVGNSVGAIIPKNMLTKMRLSVGDTVYLTETTDGYRMNHYDETFIKQMELAQSIMHDEREVLKVLAQ